MSQDSIPDRLAAASRLYALGDGKSAADLYRDILRQSPRESDAMHMLGVIALQAGNTELALRLVEAALQVKPDLAPAWVNRAIILRKAGRDADALHSVRMAIEIAPALAEAWDLCGQILKEQNAYDESTGCHIRALTLQPENAAFHGNYAQLLLAKNDKAAAYRALVKAQTLDGNYPPLVLGNVLRSLGYPEQAAACFARARTLMPNFAEATASEAMACLQMGDLAEGWKLWEQRPDFERASIPLPLWQGQPLTHLFLYEDQGLGDAMQFLRYIPRLLEQVQHVTLRIAPALHRLCAHNFPTLTLVPQNDIPPQAEARCRLSSLPALFATRLDTIPTAPYLTVPSTNEAPWRNILSSMPTPRIGLVWAGNAQFHNDRTRSLPFKALQPLLAQGVGHFVSLQKNRPEEALALHKSGLTDAAPLLHDFADTAALMTELDLIITVDTAVAHLAGALGKPVFILLPFDSDWRWLLGREDSPWYPTARLFRQNKPDDWSGVLTKLATEIGKFLAHDTRVLHPTPWLGAILRQHPDAVSLS